MDLFVWGGFWIMETQGAHPPNATFCPKKYTLLRDHEAHQNTNGESQGTTPPQSHPPAGNKALGNF